MGNPANCMSPVALRPRLATGLPFSFRSGNQRIQECVLIEISIKNGQHCGCGL
jgi:hypothetical protein